MYLCDLLGKLFQSSCFKMFYNRWNDQLLPLSTLRKAFYKQNSLENEIAQKSCQNLSVRPSQSILFKVLYERTSNSSFHKAPYTKPSTSKTATQM